MWSVALLDSELWLVLCWESCCCCCCFTRNVPSWLNFTSLLTWHKRTVIFTGARWCHTECAELIDGFDDAFALLCTCVAAPFAVHWDVQQLLLFFFYQRDTHPQLFRERGCTGKKRQPFKNILICEERCTLGVGVVKSDLPSSGMGSISQGLIFSVSPLSQLDGKVLIWIIGIITSLSLCVGDFFLLTFCK